MIGQTAEIAPADKKLYALRDATGTVESIPLIAASIMTKKLAEGLNGLVLDVKRGSGAFLPELERSLELARTMIELGEAHGCPSSRCSPRWTGRSGRACGNALEVEESIAALRGEGPADLMEVTYALGAEMLLLGGTRRADAACRAAQWRTRSAPAAPRETFGRRSSRRRAATPPWSTIPRILPQADAVEVFAPRATGR